MKCKVIFKRGNEDGLFASDGELGFYEDGFGLYYALDGDMCFLRYSGGELVQNRQGSAPMTMRFVAGRETCCTLNLGENSGSFPIFTESIEVENDEKSVKVILNYTCGGENVTLEITAKA